MRTRAYDVIGGSEPSLGVLLTYPDVEAVDDATLRQPTARLSPPSSVTAADELGKAAIGVIGSGNYATGILIPAFKQAGARLKSIASSTGVSSTHAGRKFGFEETTTDVDAMLEDETLPAVVITTRHDTHADLVVRSLKARKHIFVEKPLALKYAELDAIEAAYAEAVTDGFNPCLMVGFNRRFAPQVKLIKGLLSHEPSPKAMVMSVNAGAIPADHWTQDAQIGGVSYRGRGVSLHRLTSTSGRRGNRGPSRTSHDKRGPATPRLSSCNLPMDRSEPFTTSQTGTRRSLRNGSKSSRRAVSCNSIISAS